MQKLTLIALSLFFLGQGSSIAATSGEEGVRERECTGDRGQAYCTSKFPGTSCEQGRRNPNRSWCLKSCGPGMAPCEQGRECYMGYCHRQQPND